MQLYKHINFLKKSKIEILRFWGKDKRVKEILKKYNISLELFLKKYALGILNCYIDSIEKKEKTLKCKLLLEFLEFLKTKSLLTSEIFLFFSIFKNSIIFIFSEKKLLTYEIVDEIAVIHEKNFIGILNTYSKRIKDVEKELSKSESLIREYIIMSSTDTQGIITDVSDAFCEITGYKKVELIGKNHNILRHPDTKDELFTELWQTINDKKVWHGEIKNKSKDGNCFWLDIQIMPQLNKDNQIETFHAISQDITSKKDLEEQQDVLIEQSKSAAMGEMISMIAHQWRQPLQAVSILTQKLTITNMTDGSISNELLTQVVDDVSLQLNYMSKTIDDFRDFFIPDKNKEKIDINEIINRTLSFIVFMIKSDGIKVDIKQNEKIIIDTYVNELIQVLINILKNARDALIENKIEKKRIAISFFKDKEFLFLEIEDNGGGIDESIIKKIFEPYFSTKKDKNGTGLGLYMCKTIIEKHCLGSLYLKNTQDGAKFIIKLPL